MPRRFRKPPAPTKPTLSVLQILAWADAHRARTGRWPMRTSGPIYGTIERWSAVDMALRQGLRGLAARGDSLARILERFRGVRNRKNAPRLTIRIILRWADAYRKRTGRWPSRITGVIGESPPDTWAAIERYLVVGGRGLRGGTSLPQILKKYRGKRLQPDLPRLSINQILAWAKAYRCLYGKWPSRAAGPVGNTGETWHGIYTALRVGLRGLPGGESLPLLFKRLGDAFSGSNVSSATTR